VTVSLSWSGSSLQVSATGSDSSTGITITYSGAATLQ
jgi:hypothetical protein